MIFLPLKYVNNSLSTNIHEIIIINQYNLFSFFAANHGLDSVQCSTLGKKFNKSELVILFFLLLNEFYLLG